VRAELDGNSIITYQSLNGESFISEDGVLNLNGSTVEFAEPAKLAA